MGAGMARRDPVGSRASRQVLSGIRRCVRRDARERRHVRWLAGRRSCGPHSSSVGVVAVSGSSVAMACRRGRSRPVGGLRVCDSASTRQCQLLNTHSVPNVRDIATPRCGALAAAPRVVLHREVRFSTYRRNHEIPEARSTDRGAGCVTKDAAAVASTTWWLADV